MGITESSSWSRGERGWGSGPDNVLTPFQQDPLEFFGTTDTTAQVDETAADMFLNWVYRKFTDTFGVFYTTAPGTWQGFLNVSWRNNSSATTDDNFPGDARYEWMNNVMAQIFSLKGW